MGFAAFIDHWWNLPFLVMLGLVVVFFGAQVVGIAGHDADADADMDHDVGPAGDADADPDADADAEHDADSSSAGFHDVLSFFGVGRVPFMVVWVVLFIFTGAFGLFWNSFLFTHDGGVMPPWGFPASVLASFVIGLVAVRLFSRVAAKFVDVGGKGSSAKHDLAGKIGVVASARIDGKFGEVRVRDDHGNEMLVHARMCAGERDLVRGDEVILVEYDGSSELFTATTGGKRVLTATAEAESSPLGVEGERRAMAEGKGRRK